MRSISVTDDLAAKPHAASVARIRAWLIIAFVAVLAMTPELVTGLTATDNFRFNLTWTEQFVGLFRAGNVYPRWLPQSWSGFGAPVFYFYPPMFYWVTSLVDTVTGGTLESERLVPLASLLLLVASGLSMRAWLSTCSDDRRSLLGAVAYMLAPYHLYHYYGTGALAEATAYVSAPLVMLALVQLRRGKSGFLPVLAIAYAALIFSHLPTALLLTLFLIAPYVLITASRAPRPARFVTLALAGGLVGIALSAVFLLPALTLLSRVSPAALSAEFYRPENWFFWHIHAGIMSGRMLLIIPISVAAFLFALASIATNRTETSRSEPLFWAILTLFLVGLVAGLFPFAWKLPGLALVQFPWRALLVVEFTTVTLLVVHAPRLRHPLMLSAMAVLGFAYLVLALIAAHMIGRTWEGQQRGASEIRTDYIDAAEYLPAGTRIDLGSGPGEARIVLPQMPLAWASNPQTRIRAVELPDGGMMIAVRSDVPTEVRLRRFYFPHWQLSDAEGHAIPTVSDPAIRVVSFHAPAGASAFRLIPGTAPLEVVGRILSMMALIVLASITAAGRVIGRLTTNRMIAPPTP